MTYRSTLAVLLAVNTTKKPGRFTPGLPRFAYSHQAFGHWLGCRDSNPNCLIQSQIELSIAKFVPFGWCEYWLFRRRNSFIWFVAASVLATTWLSMTLIGSLPAPIMSRSIAARHSLPNSLPRWIIRSIRTNLLVSAPLQGIPAAVGALDYSDNPLEYLQSVTGIGGTPSFGLVPIRTLCTSMLDEFDFINTIGSTEWLDVTPSSNRTPPDDANERVEVPELGATMRNVNSGQPISRPHSPVKYPGEPRSTALPGERSGRAARTISHEGRSCVAWARDVVLAAFSVFPGRR